MPTIIRMPAFSATMESGKLLAWLVSAGETVAKGQVLAEIETDKAVATIEAPEAGALIELLVEAGDGDVPVNTELAVLAPAGEQPAAGADVLRQSPAPAQPSAMRRGTPPSQVPPAASVERVRASPAARALARQRGVELARIAGSGPRGRIVRADVANAAAAQGRKSTGSQSADRAAQLRLSMARALVHAKSSVPHFYAEVDIGLDSLTALRATAAEAAADGRAPTITAYLIRAAALALVEVPAANRSWSGDAVLQRDACHIGCAVGLPDRVTLPVVRDADRLDVARIGRELRRLTDLARRDALTQGDMGDASLTISNLGMHGIDRFFPIVNVPEALILGIGRARRVVAVVDDLVGVRTVMSCTASIDHRVIDGELVGRFLQAFKRHIESPAALAG